MISKKSFYITTTLPYVNAEPHIGFAMELIRADVIARYKKIKGFDVFFNTGTDEHGLKILQGARKEDLPVQDYVDNYAKKFKKLKNLLGIYPDLHFIRTTDEKHIKTATEFWKLCDKNNFIYKKTYQAKYCVGCELEKTDSELNELGQCPIHPNNTIELIDEENYFFKFSAFQKKLLDLYEENPGFVVPDFRLHEIRSFVERGLEDFSISRLKSKMSWGVPVPGDDAHVMYVWFDALTSYISTLGWPDDTDQFKKFWENGTPVQYAGKDNLRQQSAMWQAMLMAAGLPNSNKIVINGFITGEGGIKMSKSIGNVVSPNQIVKEYSSEALRYFLLRELSSFEDSPFTMNRFKEAYNAGLANGLGNLVSRVMKMAEANLQVPEKKLLFKIWREYGEKEDYYGYLASFNFSKACDVVWRKIAGTDAYIQTTQPFKVIKEKKEDGEKIIKIAVGDLYIISKMLEPILPKTAKKIKECILKNKMPDKPLFLRKD